MGKTPLAIDNISPGKHKVTLVLVDYEKYAEEINVIAGKVVDVSVTLASTKPKPPSVGKLVLDSTPSSAKAYLNNTYIGTTPLTVDQLKPGDCQLKLSKDGYQDWIKKVTIVVSKTNTLSISLIDKPKSAPVHGQLSIDSTPPSAQVYLNDKVKGTTPLTLDNLTPGTYRLKMTKEGYQDLKQEVQVKAGETTQITTNLSLIPKKEEPAPEEKDTAYQQFFQQGRNYYDGGLYPEAIPLFLKALDIDDTDWELHYYLGKTYQELKMYNSAIECYKKAIGLNPQEYLPYFSLGYVYNKVELYKGAIDAYEKAIKINPKPDILYTSIAIACYNIRLYSEAIKHHKKAISINPIDTTSYAYLGEIYLESGLYDLALESYQQAIRIDAINEETHFKMGQTYYESGNYPEAANSFKQAIRINPTYAQAYHFLGLTYVALGDKISANKQYEILKNLDLPSAQKLKELIDK